MSNVYLTGMMGSGKSATGKRLADLLGYGFVDLDEVIEKRAGMTISEIFATKGEPSFREKEAACLKEVSEGKPCVVATGGGIILKDENVERMRQTGKIVYLEASAETLWQRVRGKDHRPLLKNENPKDSLEQILSARKSRYEGTCDFRVPTDNQSADAVAEKIENQLRSQK